MMGFWHVKLNWVNQISEASILRTLVPEIEDGYSKDRGTIFRKRHMCRFQIHHFLGIHLGHRSPYQGFPGLEINKQKRSEWVSYKPLMTIPPTQTDGYIVGPLRRFGFTRGIQTPFSRGCLGVLVMLERICSKENLAGDFNQPIWKIWSSNWIIPPTTCRGKFFFQPTTQKTPNPWFSTLFLCYPNLWKPHSTKPRNFLIEVTVQGVRQEGLDLHKKLIREAFPSGKLTWQWKISILCRKYIFQWSISYCYVRLPECTWQFFVTFLEWWKRDPWNGKVTCKCRDQLWSRRKLTWLFRSWMFGDFQPFFM